MTPEWVAFAVVFAAVGAVPGVAVLVALWTSHKRTEARLGEILTILRPRHPRRTIGFRLSSGRDVEKDRAS